MKFNGLRGVTFSNGYNLYYGPHGFFYDHASGYRDFVDTVTGKRQKDNTQASLSAQQDYDRYIKAGNQRALNDWHKNVPNRQIRYPELTYAGQIYRADTSIARAGFDYDTASANYTGNLPYRYAGLYGIASRVSRYL